MQTGHGVIKSMDICVQYLSGMGTGFKRPLFPLLELLPIFTNKAALKCGSYQVDFRHEVRTVELAWYDFRQPIKVGNWLRGNLLASGLERRIDQLVPWSDKGLPNVITAFSLRRLNRVHDYCVLSNPMVDNEL